MNIAGMALRSSSCHLFRCLWLSFLALHWKFFLLSLVSGAVLHLVYIFEWEMFDIVVKDFVCLLVSKKLETTHSTFYRSMETTTTTSPQSEDNLGSQILLINIADGQVDCSYLQQPKDLVSFM